MEQPISIEELSIALSDLNNNKTLGIDSLSSEFYKHFWELLAQPLLNAFLFALENGMLHMSARRGVISLIPKKDRDNRCIENWRPITLLCIDYKILAKVLVNRMQESLTTLIDSHQTGFMPGRKISHNIRKILDIIEYTKNEDIPGLILSLDFFKCFDVISHESIPQILEYYGFGPNFIDYIKLLFRGLESCVQNNGRISRWFPVLRGSAQGSPASTVIFLICGQLMSDLLMNNQAIKSLEVFGEKELLVQFADDTI